jgi:hypothetical protein
MSQTDYLRSLKVTIGWDGKIMIWDISKGTLISYITHPNNILPPKAL